GIILATLLLLAFAVAKTGIVEVPGFSRFYHGPEAVRAVTPTPMTADAFRVLVSSRLISKAAQGLRPPYTVRVTEGELTGGLGAVIGVALRDESWKVSEAQIAVTPEFLEFLGKFEWGVFHVDTRIRFTAIVEKGGVRFEPTDIRFGDYPIHPSFARSIAGIVFSRDLGTWILTFGDGMLEQATLVDGAVDIVASPNP
ncbi:hypothetical protein KJ781_02505, partial [Patescibacteria group bacterium]|nr:hypothetical protein [Patescibacteria group bacterium]MBU1448713.1 hypothetical protein [Patescibacteria group bacterium]